MNVGRKPANPEWTCFRMERVFYQKGYVDHNHGDEETTYRELKALNLIKQDCQDMAETLGGTKTNISTIRKAFRRTCER